ncbi:hypothetical protein TrLO_g258 [Triparma laevis f. longispina]|uniref:Lipid-binding serum glycoprotein C-terminal domain-containing protein n=1 Tax=Triparma laevis f. longispina TaxID=1714387 RepID=A0A9W7C6Q6_9STRA|nr:hypothetical protein TrLO_g258 [Triparma laevis f. longispina]
MNRCFSLLLLCLLFASSGSFSPLPAFKRYQMTLQSSPLNLQTLNLTTPYIPSSKIITFKSSTSQTFILSPPPSKIKEYLQLPIEEYSLLPNSTITRFTPDTFCMQLSPISLFSADFIPKLYATVSINSELPRSTINVTKVDLEGGRIARYANGKFTVNCSTVIDMNEEETGLTVTCSLSIKSPVSEQFKRLIPGRLMSSIGSKVMGKVLKGGVGFFGRGLVGDFEVWKEGGDRVGLEGGGEKVGEEEGEVVMH